MGFDDTEWVDVSGDGGVQKQILIEGHGDMPPSGYEVRAALSARGSNAAAM